MATHPLNSATYVDQRTRLETYFDATARQAWIDLTSNAPVSRIRQTVRAGRMQMRELLLRWLPEDLSGCSLLDAGCGTGVLAAHAAERGADVVAIDVAAGLIDVARQSTEQQIDWRVGDMLDPALGEFDHVVAMDSLIHYDEADLVTAIVALSRRVRRSILFTFAPRTPLLAVMHATGQLFPRSDRSPAIQPIAEAQLRRDLAPLSGWKIGRTQRVASGFYTSQALELVRAA